jgi:O-antigen ligase
MVAERALDYKVDTDLPDELYQHFHNNLVQIAAEMGILAALVWLLLWIWMVRDFFAMRKVTVDPFLDYVAVNGISVLVAFQLAGLLEYNFGDSEIAILLFFYVTAPYVVQRRGRLGT